MPVQTYVAVNADDPDDKQIKLGPLLWDGETEYNPGDHLRLLLETDALEQGYAYPPPETGPGDDTGETA
ncbi:hypothetical protein ABZX39_33375 [Streptomyces collinus]|uniref:hypothetical protein n=1 Tax=Streptomyces collinus TaxID=42684 RepID=UPI0033B80C2C